MKKIIAIAIISSLALFGCKSKPKNPLYYDNTTNVIMQTEFNKESYIWEDFIFSTNKVDNTGK